MPDQPDQPDQHELRDLHCQQYPDLFFSDAPEALAEARTLCSWCPVRALCLAGAVERREPHGVWGGEIFVAGQVVPVKRRRGRPRKVA
ncbi:MAG: WhiB family transcriptional regulator [Marmoricola sp.]